MASNTQQIVPFLWYDGTAKEAADLYTSLFKNSTIEEVSHYGEGGPAPKGSVMSVNFRLNGQLFYAFNGGPMFKFTEAISMFVNCDTQEEVDHFWNGLSEGGQPSRCGWLKDKFGVSWQVIPKVLGRMLRDSDPQKAQRAMQAMLKMDKIVIADLEKAYKGE